MEQMHITLLGTGTSTGVPVPGCDCPVCTSDDPRNSRTRCSVLIRFGGKNILIDTSTDLRQQALREKIGRIDAVLYTHTHADHIHGIDDLRAFNLLAGGQIPIFASAEALEVIHRVFSYIFDGEAEPGYRPRLSSWTIGGPFSLFGLTVEPIALQHGRGNALGYRFGAFAYLTDCSSIPPASLSRLQGLDILVLDALRFRPHDTHFNIAQAIDVGARLGVRRTLLTHLSHDVDHLRHSPGLPSNVEFACDGQTLLFDVEMPRKAS